jgi:galactoside O-acetyltransferase
MTELQGFPPFAECYPGIDKMGKNCRISPSVSIMRTGHLSLERGIFLGDEIILFDYVRLVLGDLGLFPETKLILGNQVIINVGSYISGEGGLVIDEEVLIGAHVRILSAGHEIHRGAPSIARNPITYGSIHIGRGAWIGAGSTILQGVTLGEGSVIGAGSVVTKDIPPYAVAVGNPARVKHYRRGYKAKRRWAFWRKA